MNAESSKTKATMTIPKTSDKVDDIGSCEVKIIQMPAKTAPI